MKSEVKLETPQKVSRYNSVSYKFVLKSVKSQNRICSVIQYQFKASACKIWWTKTKLFFWETKTIFPLLEKLFLSIGVSYKFLLKSIKRLNRIFWAQEDLFKASKFGPSIQNHFSGKARQSLELSRNCLCILDLSIYLFGSLSKA